MSRLRTFWTHFFYRAAPLRTYAELLLLFFSLMAFLGLVYEAETAPLLPISLIFFINPCCALYFSLRLRPPQGRWYRRVAADLLWLSVPIFILNPLMLVVLRTVAEVFNGSSSTLLVDLMFVGLMAFPYLFFRISVHVTVWWNRLRQSRLIWSLVTSHLIAVALLQGLIVLPIALLVSFASNFMGQPPVQLPNHPFTQFFYRFQMILPLIGVAILGATGVLLAWLPVSAFVSYFFARRIKRRLDTVLDAAHAARDGDYQVRVSVSGQDEIANLQTDFNAMAANLELNVDALRGEREKVAALLNSRRELMASVSHELRTPIATVRAYLDSAQRLHSDAEVVSFSRDDLAIIQRETLRLQTLIDDLFALSRAEVDQLALTCTPTDAAMLIQRVVETVAPLAWRINRIEVLGKIESWLPPIMADPSRLEQALRNLIHNSLRHTPPGGLIIISARTVDGQAQIQVRDTGEGIAPEHLPNIWERYYRDGENGGTGLGLALVKSFVEAMSGQVAVESTPGDGACFTLMLPFASSDEPPLPKPQLLPLAKPF